MEEFQFFHDVGQSGKFFHKLRFLTKSWEIHTDMDAEGAPRRLEKDWEERWRWYRMGGNIRIKTGLPTHHCSTIGSVLDKGQLLVIFVSSIQWVVVFTFEISHDLFNIMNEDLGLTEEDEVRLVDLSEVLQIIDVSAQSFYISSHGIAWSRRSFNCSGWIVTSY